MSDFSRECVYIVSVLSFQNYYWNESPVIEAALSSLSSNGCVDAGLDVFAVCIIQEVFIITHTITASISN